MCKIVSCFLPATYCEIYACGFVKYQEIVFFLDISTCNVVYKLCFMNRLISFSVLFSCYNFMSFIKVYLFKHVTVILVNICEVAFCYFNGYFFLVYPICV